MSTSNTICGPQGWDIWKPENVKFPPGCPTPPILRQTIHRCITMKCGSLKLWNTNNYACSCLFCVAACTHSPTLFKTFYFVAVRGLIKVSFEQIQFPTILPLHLSLLKLWECAKLISSIENLHNFKYGVWIEFEGEVSLSNILEWNNCSDHLHCDIVWQGHRCSKHHRQHRIILL